MQTQTLTITTEAMKAGGDLFRITNFEMKTTAFCDICGDEQSGTENALKRQGWFLGHNEQFCPTCND